MRFKPEDFSCVCGADKEPVHLEWCIAKESADYANELLEKWLSSAPTVYSHSKDVWVKRTEPVPIPTDLYQAKVIEIKDIVMHHPV